MNCQTRNAKAKLDAHPSGEEKDSAILIELRKEIALVRGNEAAYEDYISTPEERPTEADQDAELMQRDIDRLGQEFAASKSGDTDTTDEVKRQKKQAQTDEAYERAVREIDWIIVAITSGDLTQKIMIQPEELGSDIAMLKRSINVLVDQLQAICSRVSSVARQVGKEGILGGQAHVPNASGIWEEMVNNGASISISPSQPIKITLQSRD